MVLSHTAKYQSFAMTKFLICQGGHISLTGPNKENTWSDEDLLEQANACASDASFSFHSSVQFAESQYVEELPVPPFSE